MHIILAHIQNIEWLLTVFWVDLKLILNYAGYLSFINCNIDFTSKIKI